MHLVRGRHFLRVVVNADVVAPEGLLLAQLVLRIDLGEEATGNSPGCFFVLPSYYYHVRIMCLL